MLDVAPLQALDELLPRGHARLQTNSITGRLGVGVLPTFSGGADPELVGVLPEELRIQRTYWLAIRRDLTELLRVRVITEAIDALVAEHPHRRRAPTDPVPRERARSP